MVPAVAAFFDGLCEIGVENEMRRKLPPFIIPMYTSDDIVVFYCGIKHTSFILVPLRAGVLVCIHLKPWRSSFLS